MRSPSSGPSAYSGIGWSQTAEPEAHGVRAGPDVLAAVVEVADPAVGDDRQPDARPRAAPTTTRSPIGLMARPETAP